MKMPVLILLCLLSLTGKSDPPKELLIKGHYSTSDSIRIADSYMLAKQAVDRMYNSMCSIWTVDNSTRLSKKDLRRERWEQEEAFIRWLGPADKIGKARRIINRIHRKFHKKFILVVQKKNRGNCREWIGAWTLPFGKIKIRLCDSFFSRTNVQEKILVHEVGHEAGILFHRHIHTCWAARRAAASDQKNVAKRSTENYAWLAMSFLGVECTY